MKTIKSDAMGKLERRERKAMRGLTVSAQFDDEQGSATFWESVENEVQQ